MDVPHHIRSMSNDNAALRRRRAIRHLRASLPSSVSTCRRVIGCRVPPDLVSPYHPPSITASLPRPPRPTSPPPSPTGPPPHPPTFTRVGGHRGQMNNATLIRKFHHLQSDWLKTGRGGASPASITRAPEKLSTIRAESGSTGSGAAPGLGAVTNHSRRAGDGKSAGKLASEVDFT